MEKRIEQRKQRSSELRQRLQKILAVLFCIALLVFFINAADMSTRRMIMLNDDKYALAVTIQEDNLLRLDLAGEKYLLNIEPVIKVMDSVVSGTKKCFESIGNAIK
jgi:hypothetical protein